jgi:hypothetical protein
MCCVRVLSWYRSGGEQGTCASAVCGGRGAARPGWPAPGRPVMLRGLSGFRARAGRHNALGNAPATRVAGNDSVRAHAGADGPVAAGCALGGMRPDVPHAGHIRAASSPPPPYVPLGASVSIPLRALLACVAAFGGVPSASCSAVVPEGPGRGTATAQHPCTREARSRRELRRWSGPGAAAPSRHAGTPAPSESAAPSTAGAVRGGWAIGLRENRGHAARHVRRAGIERVPRRRQRQAGSLTSGRLGSVSPARAAEHVRLLCSVRRARLM